MLDHIRAEVIGVFIGFEDVDYHSAVAPEGRDGSLTNPAEHGLKPRERLLDGIEVGAAGRQEAQLYTVLTRHVSRANRRGSANPKTRRCRPATHTHVCRRNDPVTQILM